LLKSKPESGQRDQDGEYSLSAIMLSIYPGVEEEQMLEVEKNPNL
jgi:hypothetical protein